MTGRALSMSLTAPFALPFATLALVTCCAHGAAAEAVPAPMPASSSAPQEKAAPSVKPGPAAAAAPAAGTAAAPAPLTDKPAADVPRDVSPDMPAAVHTPAPAAGEVPAAVAPRREPLVASVPAASAPSAGNLLQTIFGLVVVLALLAGLAWFLKRFGPKNATGSADLRIVGALNLGGRERIVVVEVGDQWIVVGASPGRVNALATIPRQHERPAPSVPGAYAPSATSFSEWLKQTIDKRK